MTLAQWAAEWPYAVAIHANGLSWTPDRTGVETLRTKAWGLSDYRVSSVRGGSIWFMPREAAKE